MVVEAVARGLQPVNPLLEKLIIAVGARLRRVVW
jgi:hypothetical protein